MYKIVLFDFDGVIHDSLETKAKAFEKLFHDLANKEQLSKIRNFHLKNGGLNRIFKIEYIIVEILKLPLGQFDLSALSVKFSKLLKAELLKAPLISGCDQYIQKLHSTGHKLYIVSGAPQVEILMVLEKYHLNKYFIDVLGGPVKKEEHIAFILKNEKVTHLDCLMFGDSDTDYKAANAFKISFVAINWSGSEMPTALLSAKDFTDKSLISLIS